MTRLAVVGGGIAGLAAAWFAAEQGFDVVVLEASTRVGGKMHVAEVGGVPVDVGAEAILAVRPEGVGLLAEAGLAGDQLAPLTTSARIRASGQQYPLPARTMLGIPGDVATVRASGVLSEHALAAIAGEPLQPPLAPVIDDVAVGSLVRSRLGDEVADRLVEPLLGGVYAGSADQLSLRATMPALARRLENGGSLVEAAAGAAGSGTRSPDAGPIFASLRGGLGRLPGVLAASARFRVRTSVTVRSIRRTTTGFELATGAEPRAELIEVDAVIVAAPAAKAARLLRDLAPAASGELATIESANMAIVSFAFEGITPPEGSGLLVAAGERLAVKAVTLTSRKWPIESGNLTLLRASVGRAGEPHALQFDDVDLVRLIRHELRVLTGIDAEPVDAVVTRWGGGLPQYAVGHVERIARVRASVGAIPGLSGCGAAYDGVGIPACIGSARDAVARVVASLPPRGQ